jgi:hypothetical protein
MMNPDELIAAIRAFHGDTSRPRRSPPEALQGAQEEIENLLATMSLAKD